MSNLTPAQIAELDQTTALIEDHVNVLLSAILIRFDLPNDEEDLRRETMDSALMVIHSINKNPQDGALFAITLASRLAALMCVHYDMHSIDLEHALEIHHKSTHDIWEKFREIQAKGPKGCDPNAQSAD